MNNFKNRDKNSKHPFKNRGKDSKSPFKDKDKDNDANNPSKKKSIRKPKPRIKKDTTSITSENDEIRLNKYIANSGICSRREADQLIATGAVLVNGEIIFELGTKVSRKDLVKVDGQTIKPEQNVYYLLNKPKDFITTSKDPLDRKTVMHLMDKVCEERIYPVGRLDRMTTGVLLFTNDGDMAKKLTHPKHRVKKIYQVSLDKPLTKEDLLTISEGVELEDGFTPVDEIAYTNKEDKKEVGIEIHSGKNRIIRRIFAHFKYDVVKLDRVYFAGLTKKNVPRGKWRKLGEKEINMLKRLG